MLEKEEICFINNKSTFVTSGKGKEALKGKHGIPKLLHCRKQKGGKRAGELPAFSTLGSKPFFGLRVVDWSILAILCISRAEMLWVCGAVYINAL
jgi:hypothetical protein